MSMIKRLMDFLAQNRLPQYFEPCVNLLRTDDPLKAQYIHLELENIKRFCISPRIHMNWLKNARMYSYVDYV